MSLGPPDRGVVLAPGEHGLAFVVAERAAAVHD
jgi:hypothetical protein